MKEELEKEIQKIQENIDVLPKNNKANRQKVNNYIDCEIKKFQNQLNDVEAEISKRYNKYLSEFKSNETHSNSKLDNNLLRSLNPLNNSFQKLNLSYYLYELGHFYEHDIAKVNAIILDILKLFSGVGIDLTPEDFKYSECVNQYMKTLMENSDDIVAILDKLYWENSDIMLQIELNFRYLYFKYEKEIDKYFKKQSAHQTIDSYLRSKFVNNFNYEKSLHNDVGYLFGLFDTGEILVADIIEKNLSPFIDKVLLNKDSSDNYSNLLKLYKSLVEYDRYMYLDYVITDFKELYSKKSEYKGLYENKLKEINKKEKELFSISKKMLNHRLFKKNENLIKKLKLKSNTLVVNIHDLYTELDDLMIKNDIFKNVNDETSYLDIYKIVCNNFNYIVELEKKHDPECNIEDIEKAVNKMFSFAYEIDHTICNNIAIMEEKNISQILVDRYRLVNISIEESEIEKSKINKLIDKIKILIVSYDVKYTNMNIDNIEFILDVKKKLEKE